MRILLMDDRLLFRKKMHSKKISCLALAIGKLALIGASHG